MKKHVSSYSEPTAYIAVNKSRLKLYTKGVEMPTFYLQKGQEFQIELFNPTKTVLLAKIELNGKLISQSGLVLNPGERIFLDRYLDIPKKFMFDTYEVSNTKAVKEAIEDNGDLRIKFYKEKTPQDYKTLIGNTNLYDYTKPLPCYNVTQPKSLIGDATTDFNGLFNTSSHTLLSDSFKDNILRSSFYYSDTQSTVKETPKLRKKNKTIETGRVEAGSESNQELTYVNKTFEQFEFHTVKYKLLPISQKLHTSADLNVKMYCRNCGAKLGKKDNFCSTCGTKK